MLVDTRFSSYVHILREHADEERIRKAMEIINKQNGSGDVLIALCGHFSAGKSSLINKIAGFSLLPSSPIPTSANIVEIAYGTSRVEVDRIFEQAIHTETASLDQLAQLCRDGEQVRAVRIYHPIELLKGVKLLDTPGIDSTDQAHALATHSALHLADIVWYMMDYNHVQSEVNFEFVRKLANWGKPFFLLINQIDKHRDTEIAFAEYDRRIRESFHLWGVEPTGYLYLSTKFDQHELNQFQLLQPLLQVSANYSQEIRTFSQIAALRQLADEHRTFVESQQLEQRTQLQEHLGTVPSEKELFETKLRIENERHQLTEKWLNRLASLEQEVQKLLLNAPMMPALLRDMAALYLQSLRTQFRSGFLWFGKSVEEVRRDRLQTFSSAFREQWQTHVTLHMKNMLFTVVDELKWSRNDWFEVIVSMDDVSLDERWLAERVKKGALDSNEYLLNYCAQVAEDAKRVIRNKFSSLIEHFSVHVDRQHVHEFAQYDAQLADIRESCEIYEQIHRLHQNIEDVHERLVNLCDQWASDYVGQDISTMFPAIHTPTIAEEKQYPPAPVVSTMNVDLTHDKVEHIQNEQHDYDHHSRDAIEALIHRLQATNQRIEHIPSLASNRRRMGQRIQQLVDSHVTVALFGAFSAGKSSFANALIGESVLPVSPNPTTAAINHLLPPTEQHPHGTLTVNMKSLDRLFADVSHAVNLLGYECHSMQEAMRILDQIDTQAAVSRPHLAFLQAVKSGWEQSAHLLGKSVQASYSQFEDYVANEQRSCFVEDVVLYHENPLTKQGISLVDTPGADSVNARHTQVSFEYIKNADIILFVTYYNHAFSQADRDFLTQLGRVKDQFAMDKMFFIINAADLADSDEELEVVKDHVRAELARFGIRSPQLFAISSLAAHQAKQSGNTKALTQAGMALFEQTFYHFLQKELYEVLCHAGENELITLIDILEDRILQAQRNNDDRASEASRLHEQAEELRNLIEQYEMKHAFSVFTQEVSELIYYVKQRQRHQFGERFIRSFNPGRLRQDTVNIKQAMRAAWFELLDQYRQEMIRELQATMLRLENRMIAELQRNLVELTAIIQRVYPNFHEITTLHRFDTMLFPDHFPFEVDLNWLEMQFKSSKAFFADGGSVVLRSALEQKLIPALASYTDQCQELMYLHYAEHFRTAWQQLLMSLIQQVDEHRNECELALLDSSELLNWMQLLEDLKQNMKTR
jgi:predicted GTPase